MAKLAWQTRDVKNERATNQRVHWFARLERRFHRWREVHARSRGRTPVVVPFPGYGGPGWVRVTGRVLITRPRKKTSSGDYESVRGWRSFLGIPVQNAVVTITIAGEDHVLTADAGGVIDQVIPASLPSGWQKFEARLESSPAATGRTFIVGEEVKFGIVSDVDDTVMVTAVPRPFLAAWNTFIVDEHARNSVPGMAVLYHHLVADHPGAPMIYLSTGAWNVVPTLDRFLTRNLFPRGAMLLTDWGPTHNRWFRSSREHKLGNLRQIAQQLPHVKWLLVGDDGQHDPEYYAEFANEYPDNVAAIAIRRVTRAEAVLAGGRATQHEAVDTVPWVEGVDGAHLKKQLAELGLL